MRSDGLVNGHLVVHVDQVVRGDGLSFRRILSWYHCTKVAPLDPTSCFFHCPFIRRIVTVFPSAGISSADAMSTMSCRYSMTVALLTSAGTRIPFRLRRCNQFALNSKEVFVNLTMARATSIVHNDTTMALRGVFQRVFTSRFCVRAAHPLT